MAQLMRWERGLGLGAAGVVTGGAAAGAGAGAGVVRGMLGVTGVGVAFADIVLTPPSIN
jgi:hypothetical protein